MTHWVLAWLRAFALTVATEELVALALLNRWQRKRQLTAGEETLPGVGRRAAVILLVNLATHPLVWFAFPGLTLPFGWRIFWSEVWAVGVEFAAYLVVLPQWGARRVFLVALLANGASLLVGLLLR